MFRPTTSRSQPHDAALLGGPAARDPLAAENGDRLRAYERVLAARDEERQRVLAVATALERRLSAAEADLQKNEAAWAERLARADAQIAELEQRLDERQAARRRSETAAAEEARHRRQRALELAFHRDERMRLDQTIAELRRGFDEHEQELERLRAVHEQELERLRAEHEQELERLRAVHEQELERQRAERDDLASRLEASERVRGAQAQELTASRRQVAELEQHLGTIATLLEAGEATVRESPAALLEEVARRLVQVERAREHPRQREGFEELSHSLAVRQVDEALDPAESRRDAARRVDEAVQRARRLGLPLMCLMIGIDARKDLRREHGSEAFDFILVRIAQRLQLTLRQNDVVMRYDDGEFLLISDSKTVVAARSHAERLVRTVCAEPVEMGARKVEFGLSIAVVALADDMAGAPDLIHRARCSLLEAQATGERRILVATGAAPGPPPPGSETDQDGELERPYHHGQRRA